MGALPAQRRRMWRVRELLSRRKRARADRLTLGLAGLAVMTAGSVVAGEIARLARRRVQRDPAPAGVIGSAGLATQDTVAVAVEGYEATPRGEAVLFNILSGFLGGFALMRLSTHGIRSGWWPAGNVRVGGRHIHHFVPGILIAFASGAAALLTQSEAAEKTLAVPFGAGVGLTFDEAALLLDLRDVYWTREGILSVQVSSAMAAMMGGTILARRMLRRGERRSEARGAIPPASPRDPWGSSMAPVPD